MLKVGTPVHVERALRVGDRISGHFVQGHVDGTGTITDVTATEHEVRLTVEVPAPLAKYLVPKGSVTLDGVSLTIAAIHAPGRFDVALIPTTLSITALGKRGTGWPVNVEMDVLTKTIVTQLELMNLSPAR
jgi:riboflavin synthase